MSSIDLNNNNNNNQTTTSKLERLNSIKILVPNTKKYSISNKKSAKTQQKSQAQTRHFSIASGSNKLNFNYSPDLNKKCKTKPKTCNLISSLNNQQQQQQQDPSSDSRRSINSKSNSFRLKDLNINLTKKSSSIELLQLQTNSNSIQNNSSLNNSFFNFEEIQNRASGFDMTTRSLYGYENQSRRTRSKFFLIFCCFCCLIKNCINNSTNTTESTISTQLNPNISNNTNNINSTSRVSKFALFNLVMRKFLSKMKVYATGLLFSLLICLSFVFMTYLLRRSLNLIEYPTDLAENMFTFVNTTTTSLNDFTSLNIEFYNSSRTINLSCNFCYFLIWSSSSCLLLVYPIYFFSTCSCLINVLD